MAGPRGGPPAPQPELAPAQSAEVAGILAASPQLQRPQPQPQLQPQPANRATLTADEEGGMAEGAMERLSETASGKFSTALDNLKLAGAALAEDLLPIVNSVLDSVVNLAKKFTALTDSQKQNILVVAVTCLSV